MRADRIARRDFLWRLVLLGGGAALWPVVQACGGEEEAATPTPGAAVPTPVRLEEVTVQNAFTFAVSQYHQVTHVAMARGIFEKHGVRVRQVLEGRGSIASAQAIAAKQGDFGVFIDPGAVVRVASEGGRIKAVGKITPLSPMAVLSKGPNPIRTLADLRGKRIAIPPGTTQAQLFPAWLRINGVDPSQLNLIDLSADVHETALAQGQIDGYVAFAHARIPILKSIGVRDPYAMVLTEPGPDYRPLPYRPGEVIVAHEDLIRENPDLVRRFVAAYDEAIAYVVANPDSMVEVGLKEFPQVMREEVIREQVGFVVDRIRSNKLPNRSYVWMDPEDWEDLVGMLTQYAAVKPSGPATNFYTNDYVPGG